MASFRTFFHGPMTGIEVTCLQSFLDHGHDLRVYAYRRDDIPAQFATADAASIVPEHELFHHERPGGGTSLSPFSDLFRYRLAQREPGTWWVDADVACLKADWPAATGPLAAGWQDATVVCGAVLRADREIAEALERGARVLGQNAAWGETGPGLLTLLIQEKGLAAQVLDRHIFYPLSFAEWFKPYLRNYTPALRQACAGSLALHLWNEMGARHRFDKQMLPDPRSFFGMLVERHGTRRYFRAP